MEQAAAIKALAQYYGVPESSVYIPQYMLNRKMFVNYIVTRDGKKMICDKTGKVMDGYSKKAFPHYLSFDEALTNLRESKRIKGIGTIMVPAWGLTAIDIDDSFKDNKVLTDSAADIVSRLSDQYMERSVSDKGLHIITCGAIPKDFNHRTADYKVEMYSGSRAQFIALTFRVYGKHRNEPSTSQAAITALYEKYKPEDKPEAQPIINGNNQIDPEDSITRKWSDEELIQRIETSTAHNFDFMALYHDGDMEKYGNDHSAADMALCGILAFWTDRDPERMDSLFRKSALMRDKWDRDDYRNQTITAAANNCVESYTEGVNRLRSERALSVFSHDTGIPKFTRCPKNPDTDKTFQAELLEILKYMDPASKSSKYRGTDDIALGKLYADVYRSIARYNTTAKSWYLFNGVVWVPDQGNKTAGLLAQLLQRGLTGYLYQQPAEDDLQNYLSVIKKLGNHTQREKMLQDAAMYSHFKSEDLDSNPNVFNCLNGVYDLSTHTFTQGHDAELLLSKCSNVVYDPEASSADWDKFIREVLEDNTDKIQFLRRAVGLSLTENISEECFFMLIGTTTRNGKSTCLETIGYALGDYAESAAPETFAKRDRQGSGPSPDRAKLKGCRFLRVSEPDKSMLLDEGFIKSATGGEPINARFLNENMIQFNPKFKLFMNVNNPPIITDMTVFDSDRVHVITFDKHFTAAERDHKLKAKLRKPASISGLFNWCIEGLKDYEQNGLNPPDCVTQATAGYRDNSDKIKCFIKDCLIPSETSRATLTEVYSNYSDWCRTSGYAPGSKRSFKNEMIKRGLLLERGTLNGVTRYNLITGYRVKTFNED